MARGFAYTLTLGDRFSRTFDKWNRGIQGAARQADQSSTVIQKSMGRMMAGVGAAVAASVPIMAASFIPLEQKLAELETVTMRSSRNIRGEMDMSLQKAREWSSAHIQSTSEVIEAQFQLATAGLSAQEAMTGVATAAVLATATGERLAASAQLLASLFNTFGQTADLALMPLGDRMEAIGDSLAMTIQRFQVTIAPLRQGLAFVTGQAVQLGLSLNEVNTALGIMNTAGIRASNAGTGLQNVFIRMDEAIKEMNMDTDAFTNSMGEFTGIADFIDEVATSLGKMSKFERVLQVQRTFGQRAARTVLVLMQQREQLRGVTAEMDRQSGAAKKMQGVIERTTGSRMKIAMNNVKNFSQAVGEGMAGAMKSAANAFSGVFKWLLAWAEYTPKGTALTILFTGAIVGITGAVVAYKAAADLATASTMAWGAAIWTVVTAFLAMTVIAAAVLALGYLISTALTTKEVMARLADTTDSFYQNSSKSFGLLANKARLVMDEMAQMKKAAGEMKNMTIEVAIEATFDERRLLKLGLEQAEVDALRAKKTIGEALGAYIHEGMTKNLERLGFKGAFSGVGDDLATEMQGLVTEMAAIEGGDLDIALMAMGAAMDDVANAALGGSDAARTFLDVLGAVTKAEADLVAGAQGIDLADTFSTLSGDFNLSGMTSALDITKKLEEAFIQMTKKGASGTMTAEALVEFFDVVQEDTKNGFGDLYRTYAESMKGLVGIIRDPEILAEIEKGAPELAAAFGESFGTSFRAVFEQNGNDLEQVRKTFMAKMFAVDDPGNNIEALNIVGQRVEDILGVIRKKVQESFSSKGFATSQTWMHFGMMMAARLSDAFTATALRIQKSGEALEDGFTGKKIEGHLKLLTKSMEQLSTEAKFLEMAIERAKEVTEAWSETGGPSLDEYQTAIGVVRDYSDALSANWKAQQELNKQTEDWANKLLDVGKNGKATEGMLTGAASAISEALMASTELGDFDTFRESMHDSVYQSLRKGIMEGVGAGLQGAAGLFTAFDPKEIGEKYRKAIIAARTGDNGAVDLGKLAIAYKAIGDEIRGRFGGSINELKDIAALTSEHVNTLTYDIAALNGTTDLWSENMRRVAEESIPGLDQMVQSIARIRAAMAGMDITTRQYLQAAEAFRSGSGLAFGKDVSSLNLGEQISELENLIESARRQAPQAVSFLQDNYQRLIEDQVRSEALSGKFGENMTKVATAVEGIKGSLDKPLKMTTEVEAMASDLERGKTAAEAIRDALADIKSGNAIPETITISTTGGGGSGGSAAVSYTGGAVQVNIDGNAQVTQQDLNSVAQSLRDEYERRVQEVIGQIEAATAGK